MMLIDNDKMAALEKDFNTHPKGIGLPGFIFLMSYAIEHTPLQKYELVQGLIKLFKDIDINGDQQLE